MNTIAASITNATAAVTNATSIVTDTVHESALNEKYFSAVSFFKPRS